MRHFILLALLCLPVHAQGPLIIAHRGASGTLPEHTLASYTLAIAQGADVIEPDVVMTRDHHLLCLHDIHLERVTNVEVLYPERARKDGRYYAIDFDLEELRALEVDLEGSAGEGHRLCTFEEMLRLVRRMNSGLNLTLRVCPEVKNPQFHQRAGRDLAQAVARMLAKHGYEGSKALATIQCFDLATLESLRESGCGLPLLFLLSKKPTAAILNRAARTVQGFGPRAALLDGVEGAELLRFVRARKLGLWPWTFGKDKAAVRSALSRPEVTAIFTDDPHVAVAVRKDLLHRGSGGR